MNIPVIGEGVVNNKQEVELKQPTAREKQEIGTAIMPSSKMDYASGTGVVKTQILVNRTVTGCEKIAKDDEITNEKTAEAMIKTAETIVERMTPEDYEELEQEQSKLEQYQLERLDQALSRIKINRVARKESLQKEITKKEEKQQHIEEIATNLVATNSFEERIAKRLSDYGIPVTKEKIERITGAFHLFDCTNELTDASKVQLIQSEEAFTIDHVYKCSYAGEKTAEKQLSKQQWSEMEEQIHHILSENGYEKTEEMMNRAKWLVSNQIPLNQDTLKKAEQVEQLSQKATKEHTLDQIVCSLLEGVEPEQTKLNHPTITEAVAWVTRVATIQDNAVKEAALQTEPITLGALLKANRESDVSLNEAQMVKAVRAKRQLEEIRLRLTVENSYQLLKHGVKLDTLPMESVIEQLKGIEQAYYNQLVSEQAKEVKQESKQLFYDSMHVIEELKTAPNSIIGLRIPHIEDSTVLELHAVGKETKASYEKRGQSYEALMTTPRSDLGDSIQKAFTGIKDLLSGLGKSDSKENQEAVRILAYNNMEITNESIDAVKEAHEKVVTTINMLKPATVLSFIRQGINPIELPLKELKALLVEEETMPQEESFSRYLYELDRKSEITAEERKAFIGIYKTLYQIQSIDGAASGAVLQRNEEFSFGNLLAAVRNYKSVGVNQMIDDQTSFKTIGHDLRETIREQIRLSYENKGKQKDFSYEQQKIQQWNQVIHQKDKMAAKLITNYDLQQTMETLVTATKITTDKKRYLNEIGKELGETDLKQRKDPISNLKHVSDYLNEMGMEMKRRIDEACNSNDITYQRLQSLKTNYNCIQLLSSLSLKHYYEVPIMTGETVSYMNITMEPSETNQGRVRINTELPILGMVKADIKIQKGHVKGFIVSDSKQSITLLRENKKQLEEKMSQLELDEIVIDYGLSKNYENDGSYNGNEQKIELLYDVAETMVKHIQMIEQKERG